MVEGQISVKSGLSNQRFDCRPLGQGSISVAVPVRFFFFFCFFFFFFFFGFFFFFRLAFCSRRSAVLYSHQILFSCVGRAVCPLCDRIKKHIIETKIEDCSGVDSEGFGGSNL